MHVLLYRSEFRKDLTESTGCGDIVRDYPFEFLKKVIDKMEQKIAESLKAEDKLYIDVMENSKTTKKKMGVTLRWEGDDLVLDNTHVFISGVQWKYFGFIFELAQHMGWLTTNPGLDRFMPGHYHRGPNLLLEPFDKAGPRRDYT